MLCSHKEMSDTQALLNRARRIEGQARGIQRMLEEGRDCADVVRQVSALRAAVDRLGYELVIDSLGTCLDGIDLPKGKAREIQGSLKALSGMRT